MALRLKREDTIGKKNFDSRKAKVHQSSADLSDETSSPHVTGFSCF